MRELSSLLQPHDATFYGNVTEVDVRLRGADFDWDLDGGTDGL